MLYLEKPEHFDNPMYTVGCLVECDGKILLLRRHPDKSEGGTYCSPGGKIDVGDNGSPTAAIIRELREETGIKVSEEDIELLATYYVVYPSGTQNFIYHKYHVILKSQPDVTLSISEHTDFLWVTPKEALNLPLIFDEDNCIKLAYGI